jgi:hypothetical protein
MSSLFSCALRAAAACVLIQLLATTSATAASKVNWLPVAPADLAASAPQLEPESPAEALLVKIEIDDTNFPHERKIVEYIRYKIFTPEKVESITRISGIDSTESSNRLELRARLVLPDGRIQEFGDAAIQERTLEKKGREGGLLGWLSDSGAEVKEKFLAISGIEAGAILEYQITRVIRGVAQVSVFAFQREMIPVRQAVYTCRVCRDTDLWGNRTFALNSRGAQLTEDRKARTVSIMASNLPSIVKEPFVGPVTDYALTILNCYDSFQNYLVPRSGKVSVPGTIEQKLGPWAPYSSLMNWAEKDRGYVTSRVKQVSAEIVKGIDDPTARAVAIHEYVQNLWQKHRRRSGPRPPERVQPGGLDDILDVEGKPEVIRFSAEFVWLAAALYSCAGFESHTIMLPNRQFARFNPNNVSPTFLPNLAVAVKIGEEWRFSHPQSVNRQPFGILPWEQEGQVGLLALARKQEFIPVPATPGEKSVIQSSGKFALDAEGALTGECTRTFTGHTAVLLRGELRKNQKTARGALARTKFGFDAKLVEITITKIEALDEAEKPLRLTAKIRWPGYATRTKDRLLLRPAVFRVESSSPFVANERRYPIHFPYRWQEFDRLEIKMPEGFEPETPAAPPPSPGEVLHHQTQLSYDRSNRVLHLARTFKSNVLDVAPDYYPSLKSWYARVARSDQHELVFSRTNGAAASSGN